MTQMLYMISNVLMLCRETEYSFKYKGLKPSGVKEKQHPILKGLKNQFFKSASTSLHAALVLETLAFLRHLLNWVLIGLYAVYERGGYNI